MSPKDTNTFRETTMLYQPGTAESRYTSYSSIPKTWTPTATTQGVGQSAGQSAGQSVGQSEWERGVVPQPLKPYQEPTLLQRALDNLSTSLTATRARLSNRLEKLNSNPNWQQLGSNVSNGLSHLGFAAGAGLGKLFGYLEHQVEHRWRAMFNFPISEQLLDAFQCKFIHNNTMLTGIGFVSFNYFSFSPMTSFASKSTENLLLINIPFSDIDSIVPAFSSTSLVPGVPTIQPTVNPMTKPDSFQLCTKDSSVFNFWGFGNFLHVYNVVYHAWRSNELFRNLSVNIPYHHFQTQQQPLQQGTSSGFIGGGDVPPTSIPSGVREVVDAKAQMQEQLKATIPETPPIYERTTPYEMRAM